MQSSIFKLFWAKSPKKSANDFPLSSQNKLIAKFDGKVIIDDLRTVVGKDAEGKEVDIVISRTAEIKIKDKKTGITQSTNIIPYGSVIFDKDRYK